jgi:hypothetical protein
MHAVQCGVGRLVLAIYPLDSISGGIMRRAMCWYAGLATIGYPWTMVSLTCLVPSEYTPCGATIAASCIHDRGTEICSKAAFEE